MLHDLNQFHLTEPLWLLCLLAIPTLALMLAFFYRNSHSLGRLKPFIDQHLIPFLVVSHERKSEKRWKAFFGWSFVWLLLTLALAGPRWSFRELDSYTKDQTLVILLDLSESMNAKDVKPSRIVRAKQKIEDLLNQSKGVKIGLIAFAADPHMITPLTDDTKTITHLLPNLGTDLVYVQGSRLTPTLEMAAKLLSAEPGSNKAILLLSDGGFEDKSSITTAKKLNEKDIVIYTMGIGTQAGAPLIDHQGKMIKKNGSAVISKLEKESLVELAQAGGGKYLEADYTANGEAILLNELNKRAEAIIQAGKKNKFWDEYFYIFLIPVLPFFILWFRKGAIVLSCACLLLQHGNVHAGYFENLFKNADARGTEAFNAGDYHTASEIFQDPYKKGIAYYKNKDYARAEEMFRLPQRQEVALNALYNLGNSLALQEKFKEAIQTYEDVLKINPNHDKAKENLELLKKLTAEKEQEKQKSQDNPQNKNNNNNNNDNEKSNSKQNKNNQQSNSTPEDSETNKEKSDSQSNHNDQPDSKSETNKDGNEQEKTESKDTSTTEKQTSSTEDNQAKESSASANSHNAEDQDEELLLNQIGGNAKSFLKNKFYIESTKQGTKEGTDPW